MDPDLESAGATADGSVSDQGICGVISDVRRLADDAKTLVEAELAYQSSRAAVAGSAAKSVAIFGAVAAVLFVFGLVALTVGLLLGLIPLITAWGATAIVAGGYFVVAFVCIKLAGARWKRAKALLLPEETGR